MPPVSTSKKELAVTYLAVAMSPAEVARRIGVQTQTINNWLDEPGFSSQVARHKEKLRDELDKELMTNVGIAIDLQRQVMAGELPYSDDRWKAGDKLLYHLVDWFISGQTTGKAAPPPLLR